MNPAKRTEAIESAASDLRSCAVTLADVACELNGVASAIESQDAAQLKLQSIGVQTDAARAVLAVLTARGVASVLGTIARIDSDTEALDDGT